MHDATRQHATTRTTTMQNMMIPCTMQPYTMPPCQYARRRHSQRHYTTMRSHNDAISHHLSRDLPRCHNSVVHDATMKPCHHPSTSPCTIPSYKMQLFRCVRRQHLPRNYTTMPPRRCSRSHHALRHRAQCYYDTMLSQRHERRHHLRRRHAT